MDLPTINYGADEEEEDDDDDNDAEYCYDDEEEGEDQQDKESLIKVEDIELSEDSGEGSKFYQTNVEYAKDQNKKELKS